MTDTADITTGRSQTSWATEARRASYDAAVRKALPAIRQAQRQHGVCEAEMLANWLNTKAVPAPNRRTAWNKSSVLRALHRLHELGLHTGPGPAHKAQGRSVSLLWSEGRRAIATRKAVARKRSQP